MYGPNSSKKRAKVLKIGDGWLSAFDEDSNWVDSYEWYTKDAYKFMKEKGLLREFKDHLIQERSKYAHRFHGLDFEEVSDYE